MDPIILASARSLASQWEHLGEAKCADQIVLHLESEFPEDGDQAQIIACVEHVIEEVFPIPAPIFA